MKVSECVFGRLALGILALTIFANVNAAGLYDDESKNAEKGGLNNQDYWWSKFDMTMLDLAIKQHQPEGRIGINLAVTLKRINDLAKKYPKHEEIKKWKAHAEEIEGKINPDANRSIYFNPGCPWEESNYAPLWVNFHWAKTAAKANDYNTAFSCMQNVMQNYPIMLKADRMKDYPEDLRKWVEENKPEADKFYKEVKAKVGR